VQKLGYQALITLGVVENPLTRRKEPNLGHAQGVIDDLMIAARQDAREPELRGGAAHSRRSVGDLQQHFVKLTQEKKGPDALSPLSRRTRFGLLLAAGALSLMQAEEAPVALSPPGDRVFEWVHGWGTLPEGIAARQHARLHRRRLEGPRCT
jgi:hypothetical protein